MLVLTIAVTHIALLIWETRYVSLTLAAPGLKPGVGRPLSPRTRSSGVVLGVFTFPPIDELFRWKDIAFEGTLYAINKTSLLVMVSSLLILADLRRRQPAG